MEKVAVRRPSSELPRRATEARGRPVIPGAWRAVCIAALLSAATTAALWSNPQHSIGSIPAAGFHMRGGWAGDVVRGGGVGGRLGWGAGGLGGARGLRLRGAGEGSDEMSDSAESEVYQGL